MITVDVFGGLGNQMFQYALGRRLALKNEDDLALRFVYVKAFTKREYALGCFKLAPGVRVVTGDRRPAIWRKLQDIFNREAIVREKGFPFDPEILELKGDIHLHGYWQSEKYFKEIRETILEDFTPIHPLNHRNQRVLDEIGRSNSISVHVRRGDYVIDPGTYKFHGVCSSDYYRRAMEIIAKKVPNPVFYFFGPDDKDWVRKNLKTRFRSIYVDWNTGDQSYADMQLMSHCKHHILANSSFSWWGAWLNRNPDKTIIAPKRWFQEPAVDTRDLIPEGWMKI